MGMATKPVPETSVTLALAELDRLEQARANFLSAKRAARDQLGRQEREIEDLRARLLAERPRAWTRVRRARDRHFEQQARMRAQLAAEQTAAFDQRMAAARVELEHKRHRLAALEALPPVVVRPARRVLEWSVPAAATVLVAFLGMFAVGETEAEAGAPQVLVDAAPMLAAGPHFAPFVINPDEPESAAPVVEDESPAPKPKPTSKPSKAKPKAEAEQDVAPPVVKKNSRPIELGDPDGDPLG
jgi:hypothetical protein